MAARRPLSPGEIALARSIFGDAIDYAPVTVVRGKWAFFQPRETVMAPCGHIHFHPRGHLYHDDFAAAPIDRQGLFIHEMCHIWQHQQGIFLPLKRHPFCTYDYVLHPGRPLKRYGLEQQAEIVRHAFLIRRGVRLAGAPDAKTYDSILPFSANPA